MDQSDAEDLMDASRQDRALGSKEKTAPRKQTCLSIYSRCVNRKVHDADLIGLGNGQEIRGRGHRVYHDSVTHNQEPRAIPKKS